MPVKYIGSTAPLIVLYGVSHWPTNAVPHGPFMPRPVLREAMLLPPASTATPDSTWKNAASSGVIRSVPRNPRFEEFCVTRLRGGTLIPVGLAPRDPAGRTPAALAPLASTFSKSTLSVP
jgi:hypothetical protein